MTKVDQNGTTHTYSFDLLGRMTADAVTLATGNPQNVDSSVLRIETSYNTQGLVGTITSFDATSGRLLCDTEAAAFHSRSPLSLATYATVREI